MLPWLPIWPLWPGGCHCPSLQAARAGSGEGTRQDGDGLNCFPILRALDRALVSQHCLHVNMDGSPVWHLPLGHGKAQPAREGSSCCAMMAVGHFGMCSGQRRCGSITAMAVATMLRRGVRWDPMGDVQCQALETLPHCPSAAPSSEGTVQGGQATCVPLLLPVALAMSNRHMLCSMLGFSLLPVTTSLQLSLLAGGRTLSQHRWGLWWVGTGLAATNPVLVPCSPRVTSQRRSGLSET